ncbi:hypothetical protein HPB49_007190 [Dermacentor silvarum]|uniref:Uncharacterized protein n=1 Tax=Dermacentor silvarum TaxID=543639 RepID=A0ACB8DWJ5_DERSI|nr:hypothetical protein HPB49_007190 [Dermacentor silvarum]
MASRKRKPLSIKDKLNILAAADRNPKRKRIDIANELGLPASTVNTVVSKRKEIETNAMVFSGAAKQAREWGGSNREATGKKWVQVQRHREPAACEVGILSGLLLDTHNPVVDNYRQSPTSQPSFSTILEDRLT